jgi:hypothetical protein
MANAKPTAREKQMAKELADLREEIEQLKSDLYEIWAHLGW